MGLAAVVLDARTQHITTNVKLFCSVAREEVLGKDGIMMLEQFAKTAEDRSREAARAFSKFLSDHYKGNQELLEIERTKHADHCRSVRAVIILLRDGFVPALKVHSDHPARRLEALGYMAYLRAQFEAMENYIH